MLGQTLKKPVSLRRHGTCVYSTVSVYKHAAESWSSVSKCRKPRKKNPVEITTFPFLSPVTSRCSERMIVPTAEECQQLLSHYNTALISRIDGHRSKNAAKDLLELDSWRLNDLSTAARTRSPSHMTKEELEKLMDCKLYSPLIIFRLMQIARKVSAPIKAVDIEQ